MKLPRPLILTLALACLLALAPAQPTGWQRIIDSGAQTSGVNCQPLGIEVQLDYGFIDPKGGVLSVYPGTILRGHGMSTVFRGDIVIETRTSPDNYYAEAIIIEKMQIKGRILRGKTASNEADNIQIRDVEMFGGSIDLRGKAINRLTLDTVGFHSWTGTTVALSSCRVAKFTDCKWLSEDVGVNAYPLVDIGDNSTASFIANWIQPRGLFLHAGAGCCINLLGNWGEPLPPRDEQLRHEQTTVLPQLVMDGPGGLLIADRLQAQDVQPMIFRGGATYQTANLRATNTFGGEIDASKAFIKQP